MAVETDDDRAAFLDVADFGDAATWSATTVNGILFHPTAAIEIDAGAAITMERPSFLCATIDVPDDADEDDAITIGGKRWTVRTILPDGTGMTRVELESAGGSIGAGMLDFSVPENSQYIPLI